jgi:hypothetical protein
VKGSNLNILGKELKRFINKVKVKVKVNLEHATKAQRGSRGTAIHFV